jgi:glycosyltransferase involved in cell wall biosynthesis
MASILPKSIQSKTIVIPAGFRIDDDLAECVDADPQKFRDINELGDVPIVLAVGRLTAQKGIDYLIAAFGAVQKQIPDVRLVIVGPDGGQESHLRELAEDNKHIIFTGMLRGPNLYAAYRAANVFVLPSLDEGSPIVLMEAMSFGKPIVASSVGMVTGIAGRNASSLLVSSMDPEALSNNICLLLKDKAVASGFGARALEASTEYRWEVIAAKIEQVYRDAGAPC